jgi:hypothetical protein
LDLETYSYIIIQVLILNDCREESLDRVNMAKGDFRERKEKKKPKQEKKK